VSTGQRVGLVGRENEVRFLAEQLDSVHEGGVAVGLLGEPGVGKSALQAHVVGHARTAGFSIFSARGSQSEGHLPFAGLHQLLQPLLPRVDGLPPRQREALLACFAMTESTEVNPFFAFLAALELVVDAAEQAPVLVCLDDLHWLDQASVDALAFMARRIGGERIALLCTSRPEARPFGDDQSVRWIELAALDPAASTALLESRAPELAPALRERIVKQAGGNPLALLEFATALQSGSYDVPDLDADLPMTTRLERTFVARADELDPAARTVLNVAALDDGDDIDDVLAAAGMLHPAPIDTATVHSVLDRGLLSLTGRTYQISHPLVGSALRQAMTPDARRQGHAALASVLPAHSDRATWHRALSASAPDEQIAAELERAAAEARRRGAVSTALAWLERAAALSPEPYSRAARLLSAAEVGYELGRFTQVEQIKATVIGMPLRARERSRLTWLEGAFHDGSTSEPAEVLHLVDLARRATSEDDTDLALQLLVGAARRVWWRDPGEHVRRAIVDAAGETSVPPHDPRLLAVLGLSESLELSAVVIEHLARWPADASGRPDLAGLLGIAAFCVGDFGRAAAFLSAPIQELRAQGRLSLLAEALAIRAWAEINLGIFDASRSADEAMRLADETGQSVWAATARLAVAMIDAVGGRWQTRHDLLTNAEQTALRIPNASSSLLAAAQLARGVAALGADKPEPAYGELHRVFVPTDPACQRVQQFWTLSYLADAAVRTGRGDEANSLLNSMQRLAGATPALGATIGFEYSRAVLADQDSAEDLFRAALDGAARLFPWHRARLELAYGAWLRRHRRVLESRGPLRSARATFDALGAHSWAQRGDSELRATGERGWRPASSPRERLSPQETQIAELAAQGLSNREIGQRLFLSHRTVSSHLYRIFPKLGVTSRNQLASGLGRGADQSVTEGRSVI
jgi:DNA-binding NarL/FixJ family response regulator